MRNVWSQTNRKKAKRLHRQILSFREKLITYPSQTSPKIAEEGTLPCSFYKVIITLITKTKDITQKKKMTCLVSLMNIDTKTLNKILANQIQQHIKRIIHHNQVRFIPGMQGFFILCKSINVIYHINKLKNKKHMIISISSVQSLRHSVQCPTLRNLMDCSTPGFPVHHQLPEFTQTHVHWVSDAIHLILCCPLLLPPSIFPSIRVFSNESVLCIRWPKYWSFSFSISPSNEYSGLIFFSIDAGKREMVWLGMCAAAAAAAKSLQSCPTLCNPMDGSPPGSPVPGILQARTLEWVAISFSNAWK